MTERVNSKVLELEKNFGCLRLALVGAELVYGERFYLQGRKYCDFVRFWTFVIVEIKKRIG